MTYFRSNGSTERLYARVRKRAPAQDRLANGVLRQPALQAMVRSRDILRIGPIAWDGVSAA